LRDAERRLARLGLLPGDIAAILVTHEHGDHAGGVFDFAAAHGATVYLTYGTLEALRLEGKVLDGVRVVLVSARKASKSMPRTCGRSRCRTMRASRLQYVLSDGAAKLGVLTDIGASTAHVEQTLSGLDALVLECNYDADMLWAARIRSG